MTGPVHVRHLPTEADAFPYDGTNDAAIAAWLGERATYSGGLLTLHTQQGDMSPDPGDVVIRDADGDVYPIKGGKYATNWGPAGERE